MESYLKKLVVSGCITLISQSAQAMTFTNDSEWTKLFENKTCSEAAQAESRSAPNLVEQNEVVTFKIGGKFEVRSKIIGEHTLRALADPTRQKYRHISLHTCGIGSGEQKYSTVIVNEEAALLVPFLRDALLNQTEVSFLCLSGNVLNDNNIAILAPALKRLTNLTHLSFYMNRISDQGALTLAYEVLPHLTRLTSLNLAGTDVTDTGIAALAGCVTEMQF